VLQRGPSACSIYLTFDHGPNPWATPRILQILREHRVPATFFMLGRHVERFPDIAWDVGNAGHRIGNQSYSYLTPFLACARRTAWDLVHAHRVITRVTGFRPRLIRPPFGQHPPAVHSAAARLNCAVVTWSVDGDRLDSSDAESIRDRVQGRLRPGSIVRLRDGTRKDPLGDRSQTIWALPLIIAGVRRAGYTFEAL